MAIAVLTAVAAFIIIRVLHRRRLNRIARLPAEMSVTLSVLPSGTAVVMLDVGAYAPSAALDGLVCTLSATRSSSKPSTSSRSVVAMANSSTDDTVVASSARDEAERPGSKALRGSLPSVSWPNASDVRHDE